MSATASSSAERRWGSVAGGAPESATPPRPRRVTRRPVLPIWAVSVARMETSSGSKGSRSGRRVIIPERRDADQRLRPVVPSLLRGEGQGGRVQRGARPACYPPPIMDFSITDAQRELQERA